MDFLAEHDTLLNEIQTVFDGVGINTQKFSYPKESEMPILAFDMPDDYKNRERTATLTFLPIEEFEELKHSRLLQILTELPFKPRRETKSELITFITLVNNYMLSGTFQISEDMILYKYCYFIPKDYDLKNISVFETIMFSLAFIDSYVEAIENVSNGIMTANEAMDFLNNLD